MNQLNEREQASITKFDLLFESRVTRLESAIINIDKSIYEIKESIKEIKQDMGSIKREAKDDFRMLLGIMLGGFAGVLTVMAHGFHWI